MNYIEDIIINLQEELYDYYEWKKEDKLLIIEKIPIYRINTKTMNNILFNIFKVSKSILTEINKKTISEKGLLKYVCLITDLNQVLALSFDEKGLIKEKSKLLLEEEDYVIEKAKELKSRLFQVEIIKPICNNFFLTRKELTIKNVLLKEINKLYQKKEYPAINYLYRELFKEKVGVKDQYKLLIERINNYSEELYKLYEIINLSQKKETMMINNQSS